MKYLMLLFINLNNLSAKKNSKANIIIQYNEKERSLFQTEKAHCLLDKKLFIIDLTILSMELFLIFDKLLNFKREENQGINSIIIATSIFNIIYFSNFCLKYSEALNYKIFSLISPFLFYAIYIKYFFKVTTFKINDGDGKISINNQDIKKYEIKNETLMLSEAIFAFSFIYQIFRHHRSQKLIKLRLKIKEL